MREIKFREFYKKENIMYSDIDISNECLPIHDDNVVIMQYTGLKDKNGAEIYEGDIVEFRIRILGNRYEKSVCKVSFIDGSYIITKDKELRLWNMNCEVIGNLYENPELLKELNENR